MDLDRRVIDLVARSPDGAFEVGAGRDPVEIDRLAFLGIGPTTGEGARVDGALQAGEKLVIFARGRCHLARCSGVSHRLRECGGRASDLSVYGRWLMRVLALNHC